MVAGLLTRQSHDVLSAGAVGLRISLAPELVLGVRALNYLDRYGLGARQAEVGAVLCRPVRERAGAAVVRLDVVLIMHAEIVDETIVAAGAAEAGRLLVWREAEAVGEILAAVGPHAIGDHERGGYEDREQP